jgi:hypothetical protein
MATSAGARRIRAVSGVGGVVLVAALASSCNTGTGTTASSEPSATQDATKAAIQPLAVIPTKAAPAATHPAVPQKTTARTLVTRPSPTSSPKPKPRATVAPVKTTAPKPPAPAATSYANCTEMHKDYPGGVALPGAVDKRASGHAKHTPVYSRPLYEANQGSDRDGDGIACEA